MSELDDDSSVFPLGEGLWQASVSSRWSVGSAPNGGYLLAIAARAVLAASGCPDPLSITAHYVRPPGPGPLQVAVENVRSGRRYSTLAAALRQGEREAVRVLAAVGDLAALHGPTRVAAEAPSVPGPAGCVDLADGAWVPEVARRYELRLVAPPDAPAPGRPYEVSGWIRLADGAEASVLALLAFADAFPPAVLGPLDVGWVPTIELTVHVRARPAKGWVLGRFTTRFLVDGMLEEDGELWGEDGRLLAESRQLALVLPRR
jgi:acyl-CoA thioesterase